MPDDKHEEKTKTTSKTDTIDSRWRQRGDNTHETRLLREKTTTPKTPPHFVYRTNAEKGNNKEEKTDKRQDYGAEGHMGRQAFKQRLTKKRKSERNTNMEHDITTEHTKRFISERTERFTTDINRGTRRKRQFAHTKGGATRSHSTLRGQVPKTMHKEERVY